MQKTANLISSGLMILIMVVGIIVFLLILMGGGTDENGVVQHNLGAIDFGLYLSYFILGLGFLMAVVFGLVNSIMNPKKSMGSMIGLVVAVIIYFICNAMASDTVPELWALRNKVMFSPENVKFADTALFLTYAFGIIALISIFFGEVFTLFKKYIAK